MQINLLAQPPTLTQLANLIPPQIDLHGVIYREVQSSENYEERRAASVAVEGNRGRRREREGEDEAEGEADAIDHVQLSKITEGLRKHGGYDLPARADVNDDFLRALADEAGWVVEHDGTTYRRAAAQNLAHVPPVLTAVAGARSSGVGAGNGGICTSAAAAPPLAEQGLFLFPIRSNERFGAGVGYPDTCDGGSAAPGAYAWPPEEWAWGQGARQNV